MKPSIAKNKDNITALHSLISSDFYTGEIDEDGFELAINYFPNNYQIIGVLNEDNRFEIEFDYQQLMSFAAKVLFTLYCLSSIYFLIQQNWILVSISTIIFIINYINFRVKKKKEINIFLDKFSQLKKQSTITY